MINGTVLNESEFKCPFLEIEQAKLQLSLIKKKTTCNLNNGDIF